MFTPFLTLNFTLQLQNQIKARFQPNNFDPHQPSEAQSQFYQYDPFQHQTFPNIPYQIRNINQITNSFQTADKNSILKGHSFINSHSYENHENVCQEFQRRPTFFGNSLFASEIFINHIKNQVQNCFDDSPNSNQNPEKTQTHKKYQNHITTIKTFDFFANQQETFEIDQNQIPFKSSVDLVQNFQHQNHEIILEETAQNDNEQISQTEKMFEMFDKQQLQSKEVQTIHQKNCFPSTVSQQSPEQSFQKRFQQEPIVQDINRTIDQSVHKQSFLKKMSFKIKGSIIKFRQNRQINRSKFRLQQFKQNLKKSRLISSSTRIQQIQNHEHYRAIFDLVSKKKYSSHKQPQDMQAIVQKLILSILHHFQKLGNDYTQKITQLNELVQRMIIIYSNKEDSKQKKGNSAKEQERRFYNVNQSTIQINLNEENIQEVRSDCGSKELLQQILQDRVASNNILKVTLPMITRTDSMEGFFVSHHSKTSQVDILSSINSKWESKDDKDQESSDSSPYE